MTETAKTNEAIAVVFPRGMTLGEIEVNTFFDIGENDLTAWKLLGFLDWKSLSDSPYFSRSGMIFGITHCGSTILVVPSCFCVAVLIHHDL